MIALTIEKEPYGDAVKWQCKPQLLLLGASGANGVEQLQITLPKEWEGFVVRMTFLPLLKPPVAVILPPDGVITMTADMTGGMNGNGSFVLDAVNDSKIFFSSGGSYSAYTHPVAGSETVRDTPNEYLQFVYLIRADRTAAEEAAVRAETAAVKQPTIQHGNWYVWDTDVNEYTDTGVYSGGDAPYIGENKHWFVGQQDTGVDARGTKGDTGERGEKGDTGATGLQGISGQNGRDGVNGIDGEKGADGVDGQSAYDAAKVGGYSKTAESFYADLAAVQGLAAELEGLV